MDNIESVDIKIVMAIVGGFFSLLVAFWYLHVHQMEKLQEKNENEHARFLRRIEALSKLIAVNNDKIIEMHTIIHYKK